MPESVTPLARDTIHQLPPSVVLIPAPNNHDWTVSMYYRHAVMAKTLLYYVVGFTLILAVFFGMSAFIPSRYIHVDGCQNMTKAQLLKALNDSDGVPSLCHVAEFARRVFQDSGICKRGICFWLKPGGEETLGRITWAFFLGACFMYLIPYFLPAITQQYKATL